MFFVVATILLNVVISAIFKLFPKYKIDALQAIVVNYVVCVVTGTLFAGEFPFTAHYTSQSWFPWSLLMGACFISIFNLIAFCTRVDGITTTTIANKLSLVIPVVFSVVAFHEGITWLRIVGVALAFPAVYFTTRVKGDTGGSGQNLFWPALLFVSSGALDTLVNYVQRSHLSDAGHQAIFTIFSFSTAAVIGLTLFLVLTVTGKMKLHPKNIVAGICVGVPNFFSIYFLIRALNSNVMKSSAAIPVINIGILVASSLTAIFLFREQVTKQRIFGLVLAVVAILFIALDV
jgi:drug/metabolite transporter (DMT)-like permease